MPHLDATSASAKTDKGASTESSVVGGGATNGTQISKSNHGAMSLLTLASTVSDHSSANNNAGSKLPAAPSLQQRPMGDNSVAGVVAEGPHNAVTPSPFGRGMSFHVHPPYPPMYGERPIMHPGGPTGMGADKADSGRRLFPSPIRLDGAQRNQNKGTEKSKDKSSPLSESCESKPGVMTPDGKRGKNSAPGPYDLPVRSPPFGSPYHVGYPGSPPFPGYSPYPYYPEYNGYSPMRNMDSPSRKGDKSKKNKNGFSPIKSRMQMEEESGAKMGNTAKRPAISSLEEVNGEEVGISTEKEPSSDEKKTQTKKQRVISPSSSLEASQNSKGEDDESTEEKAQDASLCPPPGLSRAPMPPPFYPHDPRYPYPPPPYEGAPMHGWHHPHHAYPMYSMPPGPNGYMHPPPPPHAGVPPPPYPMGPPLPYSYPHPKNEAPYSSALTPERGGPNKAMSTPLSDSKDTAGGKGRDASTDESDERKIKSVAQWQRATLETGLAPSADRCIPLKGPIPSKYWGEEEKRNEIKLPDFCQLVNFPDYMAKNSSNPNGAGFSQDGKKHCVMCGKERLSSASALMGRPRASAKSRVNKDFDQVDEGTIHIIPRQNKGLCTACDVRVWVICESALEIKWCKGCKNFRPWVAFGNKGLATKCVRCRERQREKYATQKDEMKKQRSLAKGAGKKKGGKGKKPSLPSSYAEEKKVGEVSGVHNATAGARGLRNLLAASAEMHGSA